MTSMPTVHDARRSPMGVRAIATAIGNEICKGLIHAWGERLQIVIEIPLFVVSLLLFALLVGRGQQIASGHLSWQLDPARARTLLVGFSAYAFLYLQSAKLFWRLLGEIQAGTLEQVYLSPLPAWLVATTGRILATVLETAFVIAVLYAVVFVIVPFHLVWRVQVLVPVVFIVISSVGYSLIEGGVTLIWKRVEMIHEIALTVVLFFGGALIPLNQLPGWMAAIGRFSPIGQGVVALRAVLIDGRAGFPMGGDGGRVWLVAIGTTYALMGITIFSLGESIARRRGSLGRY